MRVVVNQSNYLPWKGYFDLIHDADVMVFYDDVQFTKNDWRNRNRIKTPRGPEWLTIPVGKNENRLINEVALPVASSWAHQHWRCLEENYRDAPFFPTYAPWFRDVLLDRNWRTLSEVNQYLIRTIAKDLLGLQTRFVRSEDYGVQGRKQERLLALLKAVGATTYLSGPAAKDYLEFERFVAEGIALEWKDYAGYPAYAQPHPPYESAVSIADLLFSTGPKAGDYIWGWRTTQQTSASEGLKGS